MINVLEQPKRSKLRQPRPTDANQLYVNVENMEVDYGDEHSMAVHFQQTQKGTGFGKGESQGQRRTQESRTKR